VPDVAWIDGWRGPLAEAKISVQDRGFLFGDGAYEVLRAYGQGIFELRAHLKRLEASLRGLQIKNPMTIRSFEALLQEMLRDSGYAQSRIYIQVTRGAGRREHLPAKNLRASLIIWFEEAHPPSAAMIRRGVSVISLEDPRWNKCHLKALVLLPNVLARREARKRGAFEALLFGPGRVVREGAGSNVFIVCRGQLRTHPLTSDILPGVTRQHVLRLAQRAGTPVRETPFRYQTLLAAEEVFLTSTAMEIMPVVTVDGNKIAAGKPGRITRELCRSFTESTSQIS
jgi:D-alanine transaminase